MRHELIDWQDGILRDVPWLQSQTGIYAQCRVDPRTSVYVDGDISMDIAEGEGRGGRNALRIRCATSGVLPDFYLFRQNAGSSTSKQPSSAYLIPPHVRANRLHIWAKFPSGYRAEQSQQTEAGIVEDNYHIGTYHWDPALSPANGSGIPVNESNGWHGYFQFAVRHDLADGEWVHICVAAHGITHKRSEGRPAVNFTQGYGETLETLTRVYFAPYKYGFDAKPSEASTGNAQIAAPYDVLIDSIYCEYVDEYQPVSIAVENWQEGQWVDFAAGSASPTYAVSMTNTTSLSISGHVVVSYWANVGTLSFTNSPSNTNAQNTTVTFSPGETKNFNLSWGANSTWGNPSDRWLISIFGATGGTWTITYRGETTTPLAYNASMADVSSALDALTITAPGELTVTGLGYSTYPYFIFKPNGADVDLTVDGSALTGPDPLISVEYDREMPISVSFIPSTEETRPRYGANQVVNKSDPYVVYRQDAHGYMGPIDADVCNFTFHARFVSGMPPAIRQSSLGLLKWKCPKNGSIRRQLPIHDPGGHAYNVTLIDWEARGFSPTDPHITSGGGSLTISDSGMVEFTANTNFEGAVTFRYVCDNGLSGRPIVYSSFIYVTPSNALARNGNKIYKVGSFLVGA